MFDICCQESVKILNKYEIVQHHNSQQIKKIVYCLLWFNVSLFDVLIHNNTKQSNQYANVYLNFCKLTNWAERYVQMN